VAEPHEPSYYEIALTNRQVVVAFVILLTCVLGAFVSGVWVGREATARTAQEQMVRNTPPPEVAQEGKNLEELEFFDKNKKEADRQKAARQEAAARPSIGSTLLEDLGVKKKPAAAAPPPPPAAEPAAEEPASPVAAVPDPAQERRNRRRERAAAAAAAAANAPETPVPAPAPTSVKAPKPASPAKTAAAPAVPKGSYVIQVFSSADQAQAERIRARLSGGGQTAYLSPIDRGGRTMYRVRIGPFKSHEEAQKVADQVRKGYKLDTWVTE
jgi:cell division protein FtsN